MADQETVRYGTKETPIDLPRLRGLIEKAGYRGFLPVESLAPGDPTAFLEKVKKVMLSEPSRWRISLMWRSLDRPQRVTAGVGPIRKSRGSDDYGSLSGHR